MGFTLAEASKKHFRCMISDFPSTGHPMGANSRGVWGHFSLQIFPKLCQDTLSLCDLTKRVSRFLKLITDVPGKTALEVRDFFFFLFFFTVVFWLLIWKRWGSPRAAPRAPCPTTPRPPPRPAAVDPAAVCALFILHKHPLNEEK